MLYIYIYIFFCGSRFGPYFWHPVIAGLGDDDVPFICTMDYIGAKYDFSLLALSHG
ncbi:unnamed protein product [Musa acuminata subsp. malaccensis]|uniref:(wild Malaysian banana) hypothetical protein n=1 Tax=Musa acuminata subsp. malaccensis TaxID=214687 RepID=A0A804KS31_MUSAM|nr:unnamed protein product [Musa acuminata subsp. malaccensis]